MRNSHVPDGARAPSRAARPIVAFQGESGAFGESAAEALVRGPLALVPTATFDDAVAMVLDGLADFAVIPVENLIAGEVFEATELLARAEGRIDQIAEHRLPIQLALLGLPGTRVEELREVLSHPVALRQCTRFFAEHPSIHAIEAHDTAGAARMVAIRRDRSVAAVAAPWAAERYGLTVLAEGLEDRTENWTRFVLVRRT